MTNMETLTHKSGKERRRWTLQENEGSWTAQQETSWKGSEWSKEMRSDQRWWATKEEAMMDAERMANESRELGWN